MSDMTPEDLAIQKDGANSRALGGSTLDNPYHVSPAKAGETLEALTRKANLWELGWRIEDMMR